jgi:hypothetical protein
MFKTCFTILWTQNVFVIHIEKQVLTSVLNMCKEKLTFEGFNIVIIEIFEFFKMCINMHDGSNVNNTSFEQFDLEKILDINLQ